MAENTESMDSIRSFALEEEPSEEEEICVAKEPRRFDIKVKRKVDVTFSKPGKSDSMMSCDLPGIQETLSFNLTKASYKETIANNIQLRNVLCRTSELLKEKGGLCRNLEKQLQTLELETKSLNHVVSITRDLLSVKNLEVLKLRNDMQIMKEKFELEREKQRNIMTNMYETVKVLSKMKEEHRLQMELTTELQNEYDKKIALLEKENKLLSTKMSKDLMSKTCHSDIEKVGDWSG